MSEEDERVNKLTRHILIGCAAVLGFVMAAQSILNCATMGASLSEAKMTGEAARDEINNYVLRTGNGQIVCKNGTRLASQELTGSALSTVEREDLKGRLKSGLCVARLTRE